MLMFWKMEPKLYLLIKVSCIVAVIQSKYDLIWIPGSNLWTKLGGRQLTRRDHSLPAELHSQFSLPLKT